MKKIFVAFFSIAICCLFSVAALAQREASGAQKHADESVSQLFDAANFVGNDVPVSGGTPVDAANVGARVQKTFAQHFGARSGVNWSQMSKHTYFAQFDLDGRRTNALFANNGFMVYAISYGVAQHAPKDVRNILRSFYPDMEMGATFQVRYKGQSNDNPWADQTAWIANLEDENKIVVVRVVDGAVDELGNMQKKMEQRKVRKGKVIIPKQ